MFRVAQSFKRIQNSRVQTVRPQTTLTFNQPISKFSFNRKYSGGGGAPSRDEIENRVIQLLSVAYSLEEGKVNPHTHFKNDLALDSLDVVDVVMAIEDEFAVEVPDQDLEKFISVPSTVNYLHSIPYVK